MSLQASRGQKSGPQENIELDYYNLGVSRAEGEPAEEEGAQGAEQDLQGATQTHWRRKSSLVSSLLSVSAQYGEEWRPYWSIPQLLIYIQHQRSVPKQEVVRPLLRPVEKEQRGDLIGPFVTWLSVYSYILSSLTSLMWTAVTVFYLNIFMNPEFYGLIWINVESTNHLKIHPVVW